MKIKLYISSVILCFMAQISFAQKNVDKGDKYFFQNQFDQAVKYYQLDFKSRDKKVAERAMMGVADCYRIMGEFEKAEETYKKILKKFKKNPLSYLNYALSLKSSAKYAEAKIQFEEYLKLNPTDLMGPVYIRSCDSAQRWLDETIGKEVKNITAINTVESEFSPYVFNNKLYFSSSREGSKRAFISFDGGGDIKRMDIYETAISSLLKKQSDKKDIVNLEPLNSPAHEGSSCISADGNEIYFCRTVKGKRDEKTNNILNSLQVFCSKKDSAGVWTAPVSAFTFNSDKYSVGHPSLSADGKRIYFMSDMPGGFGKTDIYYADRNSDGTWSKPINAGSKVNTFGYELFPYIASNNILYFSSNAHEGMGQLDVFKAQWIEGKWMNIENLKPPINSIGNDFGIALDASNARGFVSSDRFNGVGAEDIYSFSADLPQELFITNNTVALKNYFLFDDVKFKISNVSDSTDIDSNPEMSEYLVNCISGKQYLINAKKNGMPYNKINLERTSDSANAKLFYKINPSSKDVLLKGKFTTTDKQDSSGFKILVILDGKIMKTINTNGFGEFDFMNLPPSEQEYLVVPLMEGYNKEFLNIETKN